MDVVLAWAGTPPSTPAVDRALIVARKLESLVRSSVHDDAGVEVVDILGDCTGDPVAWIWFRVITPDADTRRAAVATKAFLNGGAQDGPADLWEPGGDVLWILSADVEARAKWIDC